MSKTPYEIRLELLKLANEVLTTPIHQRRDALIQEFHCRFETDKQASFPALPDFPGTDTVIAEAEKLNKFVSQA
jgi:hypothetical protein